MTLDIFGEQPKLAVLIDPDHSEEENLEVLLDHLSLGLSDIVLIGGSTTRVVDIDHVVRRVKARCSSPVYLFPGSALQISKYADGLLLPSLISGRNPTYLIGKHVEAARLIKKSNIKVIPMGYILIEGGKMSTTSYVTNTLPIPSHLPDLAADTALAGQFLGLRCIYLEAGSGASRPVDIGLISKVKEQITIPLIVGGGITTPDQLVLARESGADMVVLGSVLEERPDEIISFHKAWSSQVPIR